MAAMGGRPCPCDVFYFWTNDSRVGDAKETLPPQAVPLPYGMGGLAGSTCNFPNLMTSTYHGGSSNVFKHIPDIIRLSREKIKQLRHSRKNLKVL